jgi:hypothetical protein
MGPLVCLKTLAAVNDSRMLWLQLKGEEISFTTVSGHLGCFTKTFPFEHHRMACAMLRTRAGDLENSCSKMSP